MDRLQIIAWILIGLGLAAWLLVFPITVRGYESAGIGSPLVQLWIWIYGLVTGIGVIVLLAVHHEKPMIARISLAVYVALLATVIVSAYTNAQ